MRRDGIQVGIAGGVIACLLLAPWVIEAVAALTDARQARADAEAIAAAPVARPAMIVPGELRMPGGSASAAAVTLARGLRARAAGSGVLIERAQAADVGPGLVGIDLRASGSAKSMIALADALEREAPLARFAHWRASALPDGGVRIEGRVVAAWR